MNLLAHLHLSAGLSAEETAGNVLADFLPNNLVAPPGIDRGILLHRKIDGFTDRHPLVAEACNLISPARRRLAGIIVDIAFDYTLSQKWRDHSDMELRQFIEEGYSSIQYGSRQLGEVASRLTTRMRQHQWLESYCTIEGMAQTFRRLTRRSDAVKKLLGSEVEIEANLPELQALFDQFYPILYTEATGTTYPVRR